MSDHECPQLQTSSVHEEAAGDADIYVEEVFPADGAGEDCAPGGVCVIVADSWSTTGAVMDPDEALRVAAGITEAAHRALWRRELAN